MKENRRRKALLWVMHNTNRMIDAKKISGPRFNLTEDGAREAEQLAYEGFTPTQAEFDEVMDYFYAGEGNDVLIQEEK